MVYLYGPGQRLWVFREYLSETYNFGEAVLTEDSIFLDYKWKVEIIV